MAIQAEFVGRFSQLRVIVGAMDVVAVEAGDPAAVHEALDEIIALHAVFVGGAVGKVREGGSPSV